MVSLIDYGLDGNFIKCEKCCKRICLTIDTQAFPPPPVALSRPLVRATMLAGVSIWMAYLHAGVANQSSLCEMLMMR